MRSMSKAPITCPPTAVVIRSNRSLDRAGEHLVLELRLHRGERLLAEVDVVAVGADRGVGRRVVRRSPAVGWTPSRRWRPAQGGLEVDARRAEARGVDVGDVVGDDPLTRGEAVEGESEQRDRRRRTRRRTRLMPPRMDEGCRSIGGGRAIRARVVCRRGLSAGTLREIRQIGIVPILLGGPSGRRRRGRRGPRAPRVGAALTRVGDVVLAVGRRRDRPCRVEHGAPGACGSRRARGTQVGRASARCELRGDPGLLRASIGVGADEQPLDADHLELEPVELDLPAPG